MFNITQKFNNNFVISSPKHVHKMVCVHNSPQSHLVKFSMGTCTQMYEIWSFWAYEEYEGTRILKVGCGCFSQISKTLKSYIHDGPTKIGQSPEMLVWENYEMHVQMNEWPFTPFQSYTICWHSSLFSYQYLIWTIFYLMAKCNHMKSNTKFY